MKCCEDVTHAMRLALTLPARPWLEFLPTRIAVKRGASELGPIYALCWLGFVPFGWVVALVLALRDVPKPVTP